MDEPNEIFFVSAFLKGLRTSTFNESLFIQKLSTMDEIRTRTKKRIDVEEVTTSKKARITQKNVNTTKAVKREKNTMTK